MAHRSESVGWVYSLSLFPCPTSAWLIEVINHWCWCEAGRRVGKEVTNKQLWGKGKVSYPAGIWLTSHDEGQAHSLLWWLADRPLWATTFPNWVEIFIFLFPWWSVIKTDGREQLAPFKVLIEARLPALYPSNHIQINPGEMWDSLNSASLELVSLIRELQRG